MNQRLSEEFIERHVDKIEWQEIFDFQELSPEFLEKYKHRRNEDE